MVQTPQPQTIYLDLDEEITSAIDRLATNEAVELTLVIPKGATVLQSIVNLRLLYKAAQRLGKRVVVVTRDETGLKRALQAGITVCETLTGETVSPEQVKQRRPLVATIEEREVDLVPSSSSARAATERSDSEMRPSLRAIVESERVERTKKRARSFETEGLARQVPTRPRRTLPVPHTTALSHEEHVPAKPTGMLTTQTGRRLRTAHATARGRQGSSARIHLLPDWPYKKIGAGAGGALVVVLLLFTFAFASAEVVVTPKSETIAQDFEITGVESPDVSAKEVSISIVQSQREGKKSVTPTGKKETGAKANGTVTISNVFSDKPQSFGVNTRLQAGSGQVFLLTAQVSVPGATVDKGKPVPGTVSASVVAEKFGQEYNIGPTSFVFIDLSAEQQAGITARSDAAMSGGDKKEITVLSAADVDEAKKAILGELEPTLLSELRSGLGADDEILEGATTAEAGSPKTSVAVGSETEQAEVTVQITVKALVDHPSMIKQLAADELTHTLPTNKELAEGEPTVTWQFKTADVKQKKLIITVHAEKTASYRIDDMQLVAAILGKKEGEAETQLKSMPELAEARVRVSPLWRTRLPKNPQKVELKVNR